jgi:glutathione peroxidase
MSRPGCRDVTLCSVTIHEVSIDALRGGPADLNQYRGRTMLIVNVASKCGLTPQYASLQQLYDTYADRGLVVLAVPCNQFGGQEPGTPAEIADFCEATFGVTFPITQKVDVNGPERHELFERLTQTPDPEGAAGDIRWNFEKFLVEPEGTVVARFRPLTDPLSPDLITAVEEHLPDPATLPAPAPVGVPPADDLHQFAPWPHEQLPLPATPATVAPAPAGRRGLLTRWARRRAQ